MISSLLWFGMGAALGVATAVGLARFRSPAARSGAARPAEPTAVLPGPGLAEPERVRHERAAARRRTRRAHRVTRRAERLLGMTRCLAGADLEELSLRAVRAAIDDFSAESASFWVFTGEQVTLKASATRRDQPSTIPVWPETARGEMPPRTAGDGRRHYLVLRDELRVPVGCLEVGFDSPRSRPPAGLETYAAILGAFLAAELDRRTAPFGSRPVSEVSLAA